MYISFPRLFIFFAIIGSRPCFLAITSERVEKKSIISDEDNNKTRSSHAGGARDIKTGALDLSSKHESCVSLSSAREEQRHNACMLLFCSSG